MIDRSTCRLLGTFAKTHGIDGSLLLRLSGIESQNIKEPEFVFVEIDGLLVPFFVTSLRELTSNEMLITLGETDSVAKAGQLTGYQVWVAENDIDSASRKLSDEDISGYRVVDRQAGQAGTVMEIIDIPHNPLLKVVHQNREYLIPFHRDIIIKIDKSKKTIMVDLPDGLTEI